MSGATELGHQGACWRRAARLGARYGPRWWLAFVPALIGLLFAGLLGKSRAQVRRNLRLVRGRRPAGNELGDLLSTFIHYAHCTAEALAAGRREARGAHIELVAAEVFLATLAAGRGVLLATAHLGAWDVAVQLLARESGREVMVVMSNEPSASGQALQDQVRRASGVQLVHVGQHPLDALPLVNALRRGAIVALQIDRAPTSSRTCEATLFGTPWRVPEGPFVLSALAKVPIIPVFFTRRGLFDYVARFVAPVQVVAARDRAAIAAAAQRVTKAMEEAISRSPTQWFHFVDRAP